MMILWIRRNCNLVDSITKWSLFSFLKNKHFFVWIQERKRHQLRFLHSNLYPNFRKERYWKNKFFLNCILENLLLSKWRQLFEFYRTQTNNFLNKKITSLFKFCEVRLRKFFLSYCYCKKVECLKKTTYNICIECPLNTKLCCSITNIPNYIISFD